MRYTVINISIVLIYFVSDIEARLSLAPGDLRRPFDLDLYENVLDSELCRRQVRSISRGNTLLLFRFLDAGIRTPRGLLDNNLADLGNYHQCLDIDEVIDEDMRIEGKYCAIRVPANQSLHWPQFPEVSRWFDQNSLMLDEKTLKDFELSNAVIANARAAAGFDDRSGSINVPPGMTFRLAVCIPKPCTTMEAISSLLFNVSAIGFRLEEDFCRLPNDKPWVAADTVAVVVFSLIGLLTLVSTCYDLYFTFLTKQESKLPRSLCTSFSLYTNTNRLFTFKPSKGTLECLDGIRVLAIMWVILGHVMTMYPFTANSRALFTWLVKPEALWLTTAPYSVDSFFMMGGVLLVYTTAGKITGWKLLSRLHLFYLNRLLRMFPPLAAVVLLEASLFHRIADGPFWNTVVRNVQRCRTFWWSTLLHVQNWVNPHAMCIPHAWYIAIDVQLYFISPLVLFWVLNGNKKSAWTALVAGLLAILTGSTIFNFIMKLPAGTVAFSRIGELNEFMRHYYFNTFTRGSPFFVGMLFGYLLHLYRGRKIRMHLATVSLLWIVALGLIATAFYTTYLIVQFDWDNQTVDSLINSFQRPAWALGLGLMIFACVQGYGGPINWFLSLQMWKLPSRVSYAMYLYHYSQLFIAGDMQLAPNYFVVPRMLFTFIGHLTVTLIISIIVAIVIEGPFSTLFKMMLDKAQRNAKPAVENGVEKRSS